MATDQRTLGGRYEIGPLLGYGGMAEVHLGRDVRLGRDVAVKLLRPDLARDPAFQGRFRREAQSAAALNHPSIVAVYDTGEEEEAGTVVPYIVMEYVQGRTLREVVEEDGRLLPERALEITADICRALEYSHRVGIVHRDIKPGNVMLTPAGTVKVMDFGIARAVAAATASVTQTAAVIGTAQYLSPEQARGETVDARSDLYSAGCLLYELLTGRPPFSGDSAVAVAYQHVRENPVPPSRLFPDIPASADAIVLKAMTKSPANRYQDAGEMHQDIERALAGRPVLAAPVPAGEQTAMLAAPPAAETAVLARAPAPPRRRRRGWAYLLLALAVIAVFVAALVLARLALTGTGGNVNTPNLKGLPLARAEAKLHSLGLHWSVRDRHTTSNASKGKVIDQTPFPGAVLSKGGTVKLVVSTGVRYVTVPQLPGLTESRARAALTGAGLKVGQVTPQPSATYNAGQVITSTPSSNTTVPAGTKVNLVVASGSVTVPNVTGNSQAQATGVLRRAHFLVSVVYAPGGGPVGTVSGESPQGGTAAPYGSTVTITVVARPTPPPTTPPPTTPPPTPSPTASTSPSPSPSASKHH